MSFFCPSKMAFFLASLPGGRKKRRDLGVGEKRFALF
jgi:hypothetical protein